MIIGLNNLVVRLYILARTKLVMRVNRPLSVGPVEQTMTAEGLRMPTRTRTCISFSRPILAVLLTAFAIALLAGAAAGEGTMLVDLGDDITTQEDTSLMFNSAVSYTGTLTPTYDWDFGDGTGS